MLALDRLRLLTAWQSRSVTPRAMLHGCLGKDEQEFVAAIAAKVVAPAQMGGDGLGNIAQSGIAGGVSLDVIDGFEVVDVNQGDRELVLSALDVLEFGGQFDLDAAPVEGAGQRVFLRLIRLRAISSLLERKRMKSAGDEEGDQRQAAGSRCQRNCSAADRIGRRA